MVSPPYATTATVTLDWPLKTWPNPNRDRRKHWGRIAKEGRAIRDAGRVLAMDRGRVETPVNMTLAFAFPDKRRRDLDNYSSKNLVDGLVDGGLIPEDDYAHIASVTRILDPNKTATGWLRVTVTMETVGA